MEQQPDILELGLVQRSTTPALVGRGDFRALAAQIMPETRPDTNAPPRLAEIPNRRAVIVEENKIIGLLPCQATAQKLENGRGHLDQPTIIVLRLAVPQPDAFIKEVNLIDPESGHF
jgi:hypothetical protein